MWSNLPRLKDREMIKEVDHEQYILTDKGIKTTKLLYDNYITNRSQNDNMQTTNTSPSSLFAKTASSLALSSQRFKKKNHQIFFN